MTTIALAAIAFLAGATYRAIKPRQTRNSATTRVAAPDLREHRANRRAYR